MWVLVINGAIYLAHGVISGRFRHKLLPVRPAHVIRDVRLAFTGKLVRWETGRGGAQTGTTEQADNCLPAAGLHCGRTRRPRCVAPCLAFLFPAEGHLMPDAGHFQIQRAFLRRRSALSQFRAFGRKFAKKH